MPSTLPPLLLWLVALKCRAYVTGLFARSPSLCGPRQEVLGGGFRTRSDSLVFDPGRPATPESYSLVSNKCFLTPLAVRRCLSACQGWQASTTAASTAASAIQRKNVSHPTQKRFGKRVLVRKNMLVFPWNVRKRLGGGLRGVHSRKHTLNKHETRDRCLCWMAPPRDALPPCTG